MGRVDCMSSCALNCTCIPGIPPALSFVPDRSFPFAQWLSDHPGCGGLECAVLCCVSGHSVRSQRSLPDSAFIGLLCVPETGSRSSCSGRPVIDFSVSQSLCHWGTPRPSWRALLESLRFLFLWPTACCVWSVLRGSVFSSTLHLMNFKRSQLATWLQFLPFALSIPPHLNLNAVGNPA